MPKTSSPARGRKKTATTPSTVPPLAAAVAILADPSNGRPPREFVSAYERMPALLAADNVDRYFPTITALAGLDAAHRVAGRTPVLTSNLTDDSAKRMAHALSILEAHDADISAALLTPTMETAFHVGLAFACYVLLEKGGAR